jgi:choline/glycine/proline betaine transport protein
MQRVKRGLMQYRFAVFGGTVLYIEDQGAGGLVEPVMENVAMSLHVVLEHLPWTSLMQWVGLVLAVCFYYFFRFRVVC